MIRPTLILAALVLALAACSEREEPEPVRGQAPTERIDLVLDYLPNADHAGIYAAMGEGLFRRARLDVKLKTPSDPAAPLKLLAAGRADIAISYEPELLLAREKGLKVQAIGALVQKPLTSLMSVGKDAIHNPRELRGKKVGTAGIPYQSAYLKTILEKAGVDPSSVEEINVGFNLIPAMLSGRVDATLGAFWNIEGVELQRRDRDPVILRMERVGVPVYNELIFVAREETVRSEGAKLRRFLQAVARGHKALRRDVNTGVDPLLKANPDLERDTQVAQVRATLPVFAPVDPKKPFGWQDPDEWRDYARWMADNDQIEDPSTVQRSFTNEFLPGEGI